jgi:hypothetical protein
MPELVRTYLKKAAAGDFDAVRAAQLQADGVALARDSARSRILGTAGAAALIGATLLYAIDTHTARILGLPLSAWLMALAGAAALVAAWRRMR